MAEVAKRSEERPVCTSQRRKTSVPHPLIFTLSPKTSLEVQSSYFCCAVMAELVDALDSGSSRATGGCSSHLDRITFSFYNLWRRSLSALFIPSA